MDEFYDIDGNPGGTEVIVGVGELRDQVGFGQQDFEIGDER